MNNIKYITCCRECPYYCGSNPEFAECGHSDAPKTAYGAIVPRSHWKPEPVPFWCPIKDGAVLIKRDSNDKITSKTALIITGKLETNE